MLQGRGREREGEKRNPQLRGETSARLMRRTAVRQSPSTLRLWCLSMLNTHSMIQNILKYGTVIIHLQDTLSHVPGSTFCFFSLSGGSQVPWRQNYLKAFCLCVHILTQAAAASLFYTKRWWQVGKNNHIDATPMSPAETVYTCEHQILNSVFRYYCLKLSHKILHWVEFR